MTSHVVQITQTNAFECVYRERLSRGAWSLVFFTWFGVPVSRNLTGTLNVF